MCKGMMFCFNFKVFYRLYERGNKIQRKEREKEWGGEEGARIYLGGTEEILILYGLHDFSSYITEIQYTYFYAV